MGAAQSRVNQLGQMLDQTRRTLKIPVEKFDERIAGIVSDFSKHVQEKY